ncbi:hypothetical protein GCM10027517_03180 [Phycicoccus ginsengisoli]
MSEAAYRLALTMRVMAGSASPVPWGSVADPRQKADLHALLAEPVVNQHVWQRARGYMKTTDSAVAATSTLLADAPPNGVIQVFANDQDQARHIMTAVRTILGHMPSDAAPTKVTANGVTLLSNGATVRVETSDSASSLGASPYLLIIDEFANWRDTPSLRALWDATYSGVPKQSSDTRVLIVTSAGPIGTWAYERLASFRRSKHWRYSLAPGPAPWRSPEDLEKQREGLSSLAAFRMFHLNEFTTAEDALVGEEDLLAAVAAGVRVRPYDAAHSYVITADLGTSHDASVINVCHREGNRVVQDAHRRWVPRLGRNVPLPEVRDELVRLHEDYGGAPIRIDPNQARLMIQEVQDRVLIEAVTINVAYNHNCTAALQSAFEQRRLDLLDVKEQTDELLTVVVKTSTAGGRATVQMDSSGAGRDDQADALSMAVEFLMSQPHFGIPHVNNLPSLAALDYRRGAPVSRAQRERARIGKRTLETPAVGVPRKVPGRLSAYDRFRRRSGW